MTRVYRILRKRYAKAPFNGEGAYRYGGRWSSPGVRLAYASERLSLAMIEYFVHLDRDDPPPDLVAAAADVPDDVSRVHVVPGKLPATWRRTPAPAELAAIGDSFARRRRDAILVVPSALAPDESNWLLNPDHPDFRRIRVHPLEPFAYDARFFA
ncbi:MAG: RES family NAD+ phosphorylase [Acidobacteria bacterium]|nr:RES family NAD+ phosphorylase [Acidobacteriota bacterium]